MTRKQNLQILGLSANATNEQIKKKFRQLSIENHPDKLNQLLLDKKITKEEHDKRVKEYTKYSIAYNELKDTNQKQVINNDDIFESLNEILKEQIINNYLGEILKTQNSFVNILFEESEKKIKENIKNQGNYYNFKDKEIINILNLLVNETNKLLKTNLPYRETLKEIKKDVNTYFILTTNLDKFLMDELFNHENITNNKEIMHEALTELKKIKELIRKENSYKQKLNYLNTYLRILHGFDTKAAWNEIENLFNETKKKQ